MSLFGDIGSSLGGLFGGQGGGNTGATGGGYDLAGRASSALHIGGNMSNDDYDAWLKKHKEALARYQDQQMMQSPMQVLGASPLQSLGGGMNSLPSWMGNMGNG